MNNPFICSHIGHLIDFPDAVPTIATWFVEEWEPWYGADGPGNVDNDLTECASKDKLPLCLVAFGKNGDTLGTVALKRESAGSEHGVGPWLAALLVDKPHRGRGVGTALVEAIELEACRLGFDAIYTSSNSAEGILKRRDWRQYGKTDTLRGEALVYCKPIQGS